MINHLIAGARWIECCIFVATLTADNPCHSAIFTTNAVGNWSNPLKLGSDVVVTEDLVIRGTLENAATVDARVNALAANHNITARNIRVGQFGNAGNLINDEVIHATNSIEVSGSTFALDENDIVDNQLFVSFDGELTLHPNTAARSAILTSGGQLNTAATSNLNTFLTVLDSNVTDFVTVLDAGSSVEMGADLVLTADLSIRGTGENAATVNANGRDIMARHIRIGQFGNHGEVLNRGNIIASGELEMAVQISRWDLVTTPNRYRRPLAVS